MGNIVIFKKREMSVALRTKTIISGGYGPSDGADGLISVLFSQETESK